MSLTTVKFSRSGIALFCAFLFMGFIVAPSCLQLLDTEYDLSLFIDANEEEEKKGNESVKDIEFRIAQMAFKASINESDRTKGLFNDYTLFYSSLYKEIISPPPELRIA